MAWTKEDEKDLLDFKSTIDSDDIRIKEFIKKRLIDNRYIIHLLNNKELDEDCPDDYIGTSILPYFLIAPTQTNVKNFICYECSYKDVDRYNKLVKDVDIYFYILCHERDGMYGKTGIARHDLLASLITYEFNFRDVAGNKMYLVSDVASITDTAYTTRTLQFKLRTDNNIAQTLKYGDYKIPTIINKGRPNVE